MAYLATAEKIDYLEAVISGSAMASFCVEGFGTEGLLQASPQGLQERVDKIRELSALEMSV